MSLLPPNIPDLEEEDLNVVSEVKRIPFSESSANIQKSDKVAKALSTRKENQLESKKMASKSKQKKFTNKEESDVDMKSQGKENSVDRPTTPTPEDGENAQPLTPTANLKMLFSAVSPELRNREKKKELFAAKEEEGEDDEFQNLKPLNLDTELAASQSDEPVWKPGSRKEKSLGLLCQKFLQKYKEYPSPHECHEISLDEVSKELAVERRRIYDIVNVLESVELVSRIAKNKYAWHGKTNLVTTLAKLKALGEAEGFAEQIEKVKDYELNRALEIQNGLPSTQPSLELDNPSLALLRKDKSLGIMSQKFLMLFLVSKTKKVNLDLAAKILIGDINIDKTENAKFKTKIRRLYDIANILATLNLIRKIRIIEIRDRKPTYQYIGPDVDHFGDLNVCYNEGYHRPSSRHSMLDYCKGGQVVDILTPNGLQMAKAKVEAAQSGMKKSFPRHSSFEQICQVAEEERSKLYASMSQPTSPTGEREYDDFPKSLSQEDPSKMPTNGKTGEQQKSRRIFIARTTSNGTIQSPIVPIPILPKPAPTEDNTAKSKSYETKPEEIVVQTKPAAPVAIQPKQTTQSGTNGKKTTVEQIIVKTTGNTTPYHKNHGIVPLTKDQIDAVLKSLKVPVPIKKPEEGEMESASHSESSQPKEVVTVSEKRPSASGDAESSAKRIKIQFPSPPTDDETVASKKSNLISILRIDGKGKPSPQRALIPEFLNTQQTSAQGQVVSTLGEDLALPFMDSEDSCDSLPVHCGNVMQKAGNMHSIAVQLPNQQPTILQFPVMQMPSQPRETGPQPVPTNLTQPLQVVQGVPVSATGFTGQPINFIVPVTFSPPLTPRTPSSSQATFSFTNHMQPNINHMQQNVSMPSVQYLQHPSSTTMVSGIDSISPAMIRTSQAIPHLITPTERPVPPPSKFFGNTPGGLIPLSTISAVGAGMNTKDAYSTARKLDLPDISA